MESVLSSQETIHSINKENKVSELFLVKAAIKGGKEEFSNLIKEYKSYLYKTAYLYVKNEQDALDIYQETIYKAYISIRKLKKPEFFKTWITRILINNANDKLKDKNKDNILLDETLQSNENEAISIEEKIDLYKAIDSLNEKYKTPIILKYFHDMSIKEIANVMDCKENTVKSYIHRAKAILVKNLKEDM